MSRVITRSINEPVRPRTDWQSLWAGADQGVIAAWERGRQYVAENGEVAAAAMRGELPILPWKGGVERLIKGRKYGCLYYLAMWHGLRGDDLVVDLDAEVDLVCSKTGMRVTFTGDMRKYTPAGE